MAGCFFSTSTIRLAETEALGSMIDTIEIIRKDMMICMVYCKNAIISPTCICPASTPFAPNQTTVDKMIQTPVIVTFANQKGGVGKTTLCVTFANYLVTKGVRAVLIDCDFQHSIMKCRKADIKKYGEEAVPYDVLAYEANDKQAMTALMEKLHNDPSIDVVLMDSPGNLKAEGLIPMFVNSDIIVVPFHYDLVTVPSTASFLLFIDRLRKAVGGRMKARLFIVPNLHDGRVGKRSELELWENTGKTFANYGLVTDKIPKRADMERFSTVAELDMQAGIVSPVFDKIYAGIFGDGTPKDINHQ